MQEDIRDQEFFLSPVLQYGRGYINSSLFYWKGLFLIDEIELMSG